MFGYVRPLKPELLVREFSRYRSVYCGLCKQIGRDYGQLPRLAVGYDLTLLTVLLLSLAKDPVPEQLEGCVLNPLLKKPVSRSSPVLELCAGLSVLLAWHKISDNIRDSQSLRDMGLLAVFSPAKRKAKRRFPVYDQIIEAHMADLTHMESGEPDLAASEIFGRMLQQIFTQAAGLVTDQIDLQQAAGWLGRDLGIWIYLLDAIDDLTDDCNNGNWNPFCRQDPALARETADLLLVEREIAADRTAALLPYLRDGGLIANIITKGLPSVRGQVMRGEKPGRL